MPLTVTSVDCLILAEASGVLEKDEIVLLTGEIDRFIARRERFLVVGDALRAESVSAAARKLVGEHRKAHVGSVEALDLGLVLAIGSPVMRGAMTAISWFSGQFSNLRSVERRVELAHVARERLEAEGIRLSAKADLALDVFVGRRAP